MKHFKAIGLMSGTSMDGLDCGLFDIILSHDYQLDWKCQDFKTIPYSEHMRSLMIKAISGYGKDILDAHIQLGQTFISFIKEFITLSNSLLTKSAMFFFNPL